MGYHKSAEEIEKEYLQAFGEDIGQICYALNNEVTWLHVKWLEYKKLYANSKKRIDLLNSTAAFFFGLIQDILWKDILLHIARLADKPKQGNYANLTILCLSNITFDKCHGSKLDVLIEDAKKQSCFARTLRNKLIAHKDLSEATDKKADPLPDVSRQNVENILRCFRDIMNQLHISYFGAETCYEHFLTIMDADMLVDHLATSKKAEERRIQRIKDGKPLPEDFESQPII